MVKIIHISDWHGHWEKLPKADLYIYTGDMTKNYVVFTGHPLAEELEAIKQENELKGIGNLRKYLGSSDAPVVVVRGNHDYVDLGPSFGGEYFEINHDPTRSVEYAGFKIGGFRGVPPVGNWNDLVTPRQMSLILEALPEDLDILVSHGPPKHILANVFGSLEYTGYFHDHYMEKKHLPKLCCFGHIHEAGKQKVYHYGVLFSNASLGTNIIDLE